MCDRARASGSAAFRPASHEEDLLKQILDSRKPLGDRSGVLALVAVVHDCRGIWAFRRHLGQSSARDAAAEKEGDPRKTPPAWCLRFSTMVSSEVAGRVVRMRERGPLPIV